MNRKRPTRTVIKLEEMEILPLTRKQETKLICELKKAMKRADNTNNKLTNVGKLRKSTLDKVFDI